MGIQTTAVFLGARGSLWWVSFWWAMSTIFFVFINIPVAVANAVYATWLVWLISQNDSPENAKRVYKYSVAYPYIVGAVAGVQLVLFNFFTLYLS